MKGGITLALHELTFLTAFEIAVAEDPTKAMQGFISDPTVL